MCQVLLYRIKLKWNFVSSAFHKKSSRSTWACELKLNRSHTFRRVDVSRSTWACELKFRRLDILTSDERHAPRERVSWNRSWPQKKWLQGKSRSTWACELKSSRTSSALSSRMSRSTWACELKFRYENAKNTCDMSRSTWACELKLSRFQWHNKCSSHAPRERVSWNGGINMKYVASVRSRSTWACELKLSNCDKSVRCW